MTEARSVPRTRLARLGHMGKLVGGMTGGALGEGIRQIKKGQSASIGALLMTPANARRLADKLAQMRGAAMKLGQLLSMESGELLPPELAAVLHRLQSDAYRMPMSEVNAVLETSWGKNWSANFSQFSFQPLSAASIGQVHQGILKNGQKVAVKIQYPGIRSSIDSDVNNVVTLLRLFQLLPKTAEITRLIEEAKIQLKQETDYLKEAGNIDRFSLLLIDDLRFKVPSVHHPLTTENVLTMEFMPGRPIDEVSNPATAAQALLNLTMREVFEWGVVQTDPNFANYLVDPSSGEIHLLDFGAILQLSENRRYAFKRLLAASFAETADAEIKAAAGAVGYIEPDDPEPYQDTLIEMIKIACEPLRSDAYDFYHSDVASRLVKVTSDLRLSDKFNRFPPTDVLFLHRKLSGLYLLFSRLKATVPVSRIVKPYLFNEADKA
ncbi:MAG: ABC1 kinase family protein [Thiotrichales bacterium]